MSLRKLRPIILAGGSGKRLWPLSTKERPKQFLPLFGDLSLFDLTLQRINQRDLFKKPIIVTSEDYRSLVEESLVRTGLEVSKIIFEPEAKNTFPALALSTLIALKENEDEDFIILPSDHYISSNRAFYEICSSIISQFNYEGLTLMGVEPDRPSSEYGYISVKASNDFLKEAKSFIEKPDLKKAKQLMKQPYTFWNSGIFCFGGRWFKESIKKNQLKRYNGLKELLSFSDLDQVCVYFNKRKFSQLENISFDKAFVESNERNFMATLDAGWSDLGSWHSLSNLQKNPENGLTLYPQGLYPRAERPWGYFEILLESDNSKVKVLSVETDQKLSMQMHKYRSETWYITQGVATITKGDQTLELFAGDSITIEKNEKHRIENSGFERLEIIEIQTGTYFGEDDIVRLEDIYGRTEFH